MDDVDALPYSKSSISLADHHDDYSSERMDADDVSDLDDSGVAKGLQLIANDVIAATVSPPSFDHMGQRARASQMAKKQALLDCTNDSLPDDDAGLSNSGSRSYSVVDQHDGLQMGDLRPGKYSDDENARRRKQLFPMKSLSNRLSNDDRHRYKIVALRFDFLDFWMKQRNAPRSSRWTRDDVAAKTTSPLRRKRRHKVQLLRDTIPVDKRIGKRGESIIGARISRRFLSTHAGNGHQGDGDSDDDDDDQTSVMSSADPRPVVVGKKRTFKKKAKKLDKDAKGSIKPGKPFFGHLRAEAGTWKFKSSHLLFQWPLRQTALAHRLTFRITRPPPS
jgi:hypothetical protein